MITLNFLSRSVAGLALAASAVGAFAQPVEIYSNVNPAANQGAIYGTSAEYGDEISLAGWQRNLTQFQFDYYSSFSEAAGLRVRFYKMDGAQSGASVPTPGSLLFESAKFDIKAGYQTVNLDFTANLLNIPADRIAWTVQFDGIGGNESAGILLYDNPTVGSSGNDFWLRNGSIWSLSQVGNGKIANFNAKAIAVPEPSTDRKSTRLNSSH